MQEKNINDVLSNEDIDIIGEVANITIGTGATTLNRLFQTTVKIDTPHVKLDTREDLIKASQDACVFVEIKYAEGLNGSNTVLLQESDVKLIAGKMLGTGNQELREELNDMHLSATSEAMNQMMGSAATSLSSMLDKKITISPPELSIFDIEELMTNGGALEYLGDEFITVTTALHLGEKVTSMIMQFYPLDLTHEICQMFKNARGYERKTSIFRSY